MKAIFRSRLCAVMLGMFVMGAAAQSPRTGLWDLSAKWGGSAEMDALQKQMTDMRKRMAQMPPEERMKTEAYMARQLGVRWAESFDGATVTRICLTEEMVQRDDFADLHPGPCQITRRERSGDTLEMAWTCAKPASDGEVKYTFHSREAYRVKARSTQQQGGKAEAVTIEGHAKWVSADCGNLAPTAAPKK